MKKAFLSGLAVLALANGANATKLYVDDNGQVWTKPAEGRKELKESTPWYSHADKLKFSTQAFIGYKNKSYADSSKQNEQDFQIRRGYFQVKAYLLDDKKSYYRVTFDVKNNPNFDSYSLDVRAKYLYLYLDNVLPATGVEIGLAHRPWHDYEEHNSWLYRSISEVLIENKNSAHLSSSADYGVMFKTRTKYFDSDIGVFNGEGYHGKQNSNGMSLEWRLTGHLLGTHGHPEKNTYFDASFFGQLNQKHYKIANNTYEDLHFYGFHTVFNMPSFLASAQYVTSTNTSKNKADHASKGSGNGYSVYAEGRVGSKHQYKAFARYDYWKPEVKTGATRYARKTYIAGLAWKQNKNVEWIANTTIENNDHASGSANPKNTSYMVTAELNF